MSANRVNEKGTNVNSKNDNNVEKMRRAQLKFMGGQNEKVAEAYRRGVEQYQALTGKKIKVPDLPKGQPADPFDTQPTSGGHVDAILNARKRGRELMNAIKGSGKSITGPGAAFPPARALKANERGAVEAANEVEAIGPWVGPARGFR